MLRTHRLWLVAASLAVCPRAVHGQDVVLTPVSGQVGVDFDGLSGDIRQSAQPVAVRQAIIREWLGVRVGGYWHHPGLLRADLYLRPQLGQYRWTGEPDDPNGNLRRIDGAVSLAVLHATPVALSVRGRRSAVRTVERFGSESDVDLSEWGVGARVRIPFNPASVEYTDSERDYVRQTAPGRSLREWYRARTLTAGVSNRRTRVQFQLLSRDDRLLDLDYTSVDLRVGHNFSWGKGSRLLSNFNLYDRDGYAARNTKAWSQTVHLQHTTSVATDAWYRLTSQGTEVGNVSAWVASFEPHYRSGGGVTVGLEGFGEGRRAGRTTSARYRAGGRAELRRAFGAFTVTAGGSAGYEWQSQMGTGGTGLVVGERHLIDAASRFLLDEADVDPSTVQVFSANRAVLFQETIDYRLLPEGAFTALEVLPGGRIAEGDTVVVDYAYLLPANGSGNAVKADYRVTASWSGVRLYHRRFVYDPIGDAEALPWVRWNDIMETGVGASFPLTFGFLALQADHRRQVLEETTNQVLSAMATFRASLPRSLAFVLRGGGIHQTGNALRYDRVTGESIAEWQVLPVLRLTGRVSVWAWRQNGRHERFVGAGAGAIFRAGKMHGDLRFDRYSWENGFDRVENRLLFRLVREF
jgi:hypothetical protein